MKYLLLLLLTTSALSAAAPNWPQFRGPNASGVSDDARPPVQFGPGSNQLWKVTVPRGISSPVVWGDRLFLTALENSKLLTLAYDLRDGRELWRQVAPAAKIEPCHEFSSPAAPTPAGGRSRRRRRSSPAMNSVRPPRPRPAPTASGSMSISGRSASSPTISRARRRGAGRSMPFLRSMAPPRPRSSRAAS